MKQICCVGGAENNTVCLAKINVAWLYFFFGGGVNLHFKQAWLIIHFNSLKNIFTLHRELKSNYLREKCLSLNFEWRFSSPAGYPVSQSGQEVLRSQPAVSQQHRWFSPHPNKLQHRYLSGCPKGLFMPPSCLLHSTPTPASPVHPLHPNCCL